MIKKVQAGIINLFRNHLRKIYTLLKKFMIGFKGSLEEMEYVDY